MVTTGDRLGEVLFAKNLIVFTMSDSSGSGKHLRFSGREEDFEAFSDQFEAKLHLKKLRKTLLGKETQRDGETDEAYDERLEENQMSIWCEWVQCLDTKRITLQRPHKHNGSEAWKAMLNHFKSSERP